MGMEETKQKEIRKREGKLKDQEKAVYEGNLKRESKSENVAERWRS